MPTSDELILKQFAAARGKLDQQKRQGQEDLQMGLDRQKALSGLQGGAALKADSKARKQFEEGFSGAQADLEASEAGARQAALAQKEQREYQTAERLGSQQFASGERQASQGYASQEAEKGRSFQASQADRDRAIQESQFKSTFGLSEKQFAEAKNQFSQQMKFNEKEFTENQKTNLINSLTALEKAGIKDSRKLYELKNVVNQARILPMGL